MSSYMSRVSEDLVAREEEYLRINAEIEQKTRLLVEEVANISMEQEQEPSSMVDYSPEPRGPGLSFVSNKSPILPMEKSGIFETEIPPAAHQNISTPPEVLPAEARDLGPDATLRLLKAKVRVLEEEVERLTVENNQQKQTLVKNKQMMSTEKEEKNKMQKTIQMMQGQLEKYSKLADEKKNQNKVLEMDLVKLRKDIEAMERSEKKSGQSQKSVEVRLDRCLEEIEKYKTLLSAERAKSAECSNVDKETFGKLSNENKILQKQKTELINAYKKQMKLIDVLRKQKLHLEASRMLNFTQEEFMKVLDWKNA
ncbi:testis-expressed protein 9-like [Bolinopsis microptera]|uniref:testis-expressed protein 9-like n=1 Tax=Bolinopsis microptera TaxID=2820187 RepID=UPI00307ADC77